MQGKVLTVEGGNINNYLRQAESGDLLIVKAGYYKEKIVVDKSIELRGDGEAIIDGGGEGSVITIKAEGVKVRGFRIIGSGDHLDEENSGIEILAKRAFIEDNILEDVLFGIYLKEAHGSVIKNNIIRGKDLPEPRRGDLIRVWNSSNVEISSNVLDKGRDMVIWYSEGIKVLSNTVSHSRYGIHFMYCDDALLRNNVLMGNSVGIFMMYSRRSVIERNFVYQNRGVSGFGVGLKDLDDSVITDNFFIDNRVGIFVDNSPREEESKMVYLRNYLALNDVGIILMASVRRNFFYDNSFVKNGIQVEIEGSDTLSTVVWDKNFWSDYGGFDEDGDGWGEIPYKLVRLYENIASYYPTTKIFRLTLTALAVDFASKVVPLIEPKAKVVDLNPRTYPIYPEYKITYFSEKSRFYNYILFTIMVLIFLGFVVKYANFGEKFK